jgi:hypothetical protein
MPRKRKLKAPEISKPEDLLYKSMNSLLSPVPLASLAFESLLASPLEARTQRWQVEITRIVNALQEKHGLKMNDLASKPEFVSSVLYATTIALRNHQDEKLQALSNAIISSATMSRDESLEYLDLVFIRYVDELTPLHTKLLSLYITDLNALGLFKDYAGFYEKVGSKFGPAINRDEFVLVNSELSAKGLIRISNDMDSFEDIYQGNSMITEDTNDNLPRVVVTEVGKRFIEFISPR